MSSILPPSNRLWWKESIDKTEWAWITIAFVWGMVMFVMMIYWHIYGKQNLSNEGLQDHAGSLRRQGREVHRGKYRPQETGLNGDEIPVVKVPAGGDGYLIARLWNWYPILELEKGKEYKIHLSSMDYNHGFSLQPVNINIQVIPTYEHVVKMTPTSAGTFAIVCNEFCGIGHHTMLGRIYVK